jgi:hypothetical protein
MGSFSIWHWLIVLIIWLTIGYPWWRIVRRAGKHPALSLLLFVPLVNVVFLWWFAFAHWPRETAGPSTAPGQI